MFIESVLFASKFKQSDKMSYNQREIATAINITMMNGVQRACFRKCIPQFIHDIHKVHEVIS